MHLDLPWMRKPPQDAKNTEDRKMPPKEYWVAFNVYFSQGKGMEFKSSIKHGPESEKDMRDGHEFIKEQIRLFLSSSSEFWCIVWGKRLSMYKRDTVTCIDIRVDPAFLANFPGYNALVEDGTIEFNLNQEVTNA